MRNEIHSSSLQALLEADNAARSIEVQVRDAAERLGISVSSSAPGCVQGKEERLSFTGREEWVLRWLLNKLNAQADAGARARSEPAAWTLLWRLVQIVPIANAARLLQASRFLQVLDQTLREALSLASSIQTTQSDPELQIQHLQCGSSSDASASSRTVVESMPPPTRKRKRSGNAEQVVTKPVPQQGELLRLITSISRVADTIVGIAKGRGITEEVSQLDFSREHMKSVLRSDATFAAGTLGAFLDLLCVLVVRSPGPLKSAQSGFTIGIKAMLDIWESRSRVGDDTEGTNSNELFASLCLVPTLLLHNSPLDRESLLTLDSLVARHILLPARASFIDASAMDHSTLSAKASTLQKLLSAVRSEVKGHIQSLFPDAETDRMIGTLPALFELAIRCTPARKRGARNKDASWLEAVLVVLAESADIQVTVPSTTDFSRSQTALLEQLLQIAIDRGIPVSTTTLQTITAEFTGLFGDDVEPVVWSICAKILKMNADVFLAPRDSASTSHHSLATDKLLEEPLLSKIFALARSQYVDAAKDQNFVQQQIFLPLIDEMSKARNLVGFIARWKTGLETLPDWPPDTDATADVPLIGFVEDEDTTSKLQEVLDSALTATQMHRILDSAVSSLKIAASDEAISMSPSILIVDVFLGATLSEYTVYTLQDVVGPLYFVLLELITSRSRPICHRYRLWRSLARIQTGWAFALVEYRPHGDSPTSLLSAIDEAHSAMISAVESNGNFKLQSVLMEGFEAFGFVMSLLRTNTEEAIEVSARQAANSMLASLLSLLEDDDRNRLQCDRGLSSTPGQLHRSRASWNGRPDDLQSTETLTVSLLARLNFQYPETLLVISSDLRQALYGHLFRLSDDPHKPLDTPEASFSICLVLIWHGLLKSDFILNHLTVKDDVVKVLLSNLRPVRALGLDDISKAFYSHAAASALLIPLEVLNRTERETMLDSVLEIFDLDEPGNPYSQLSLAVKLMHVPNSTARLARDHNALWSLAYCLSKGNPHHQEDLLAIFEELVRLTLKHVLSIANQERSREYLEGYCSKLRSYTANVDTLVHHLFPLSLIKISLDIFWENEMVPLVRTDPKAMMRLRQSYLSVLRSDLQALRPQGRRLLDPSSLSSLDPILKAIAAAPGLEKIDEPARPTLEHITELLVPRPAYAEDVLSLQDLHHTYVGCGGSLPIFRILACTRRSQIFKVLEATTSMLNEGDRTGVLRFVRGSYSLLGEEQKLEFLSRLETGTFGSASHNSQLLLLRTCVLSAQDQSDQHKRVLGSICIGLLNKLHTTESARQFRLTASCLETILLNKPWAISQWIVETVLSSIVSVSISSGPNLPPRHAGTIFDRLCKLFAAILAAHRLKLRGRLHLVVQAMQAMLRLLFLPDAHVHNPKSAQAAPRPPWLSGRSTALQPPQAAAYARLLTTLCDPSASALTSAAHRAKQQLTPAADKARRLAGQHLPYLLMDYARCRLHSRLAPQVKDALLPGLYAVFEVSTPETLRTINALLDTSSRAVFKALADEHRRFGKWDRT